MPIILFPERTLTPNIIDTNRGENVDEGIGVIDSVGNPDCMRPPASRVPVNPEGANGRGQHSAHLTENRDATHPATSVHATVISEGLQSDSEDGCARSECGASRPWKKRKTQAEAEVMSQACERAASLAAACDADIAEAAVGNWSAARHTDAEEPLNSNMGVVIAGVSTRSEHSSKEGPTNSGTVDMKVGGPKCNEGETSTEQDAHEYPNTNSRDGEAHGGPVGSMRREGVADLERGDGEVRMQVIPSAQSNACEGLTLCFLCGMEYADLFPLHSFFMQQ